MAMTKIKAVSSNLFLWIIVSLIMLSINTQFDILMSAALIYVVIILKTLCVMYY